MNPPSDKPGYEQPFPITFTLWDAGCLSGILQGRIHEVECRLATAGDMMDAERREYAELLLGQMRGCLEAVTAAKAAFLHRR